MKENFLFFTLISFLIFLFFTINVFANYVVLIRGSIFQVGVWRNESAAWPVANPVITCASVSDSGFPSNFVADPFLYVQVTTVYLFFFFLNIYFILFEIICLFICLFLLTDSFCLLPVIKVGFRSFF